ncbi:MAG TPA: hypothetical protein VEU47_19145 [Candidatus Cybelea sp.]|nr:hypothetical protein [Candidatus Cybelea sp.]
MNWWWVLGAVGLAAVALAFWSEDREDWLEIGSRDMMHEEQEDADAGRKL